MAVILPFAPRFFKTKHKERKLSYSLNALLFIFSTLVISLFVHLLFKAFKPNVFVSGFTFYLQLVIGIGVLLLLKYVFENIVSIILNIEHLITKYTFYKSSFRYFFSFILFPFVIINTYSIEISSLLLNLLIVFFAIFYLIVLIWFYAKNRSLIISNLFYFILYLCALEISPYLILYKLVN